MIRGAGEREMKQLAGASEASAAERSQRLPITAVSATGRAVRSQIPFGAAARII